MNESYQKDLEYNSHYADGVILQIKNGMARLIFYEEELNPTDDSSDPNIHDRSLKLKFEVRLNKFAVTNLANHISYYKYLSDFGLAMADLTNNDGGVISKWSKYSNKLGELLMDSEKTFPLDKLSLMADISEDLLFKAISVSNNQSILHNNTNKEIKDAQE